MKGRDIQYGHKLNLTTGKEGLVLDATIESGNPCDTERYLPMIQRLEPIYGQMPTGSRQTVVMPARPICMKRRLWA